MSVKKIFASVGSALCFYAIFGTLVPYIPNSRLNMSIADWYTQCLSEQRGTEGSLVKFIDRTNVSFALWMYPPSANIARQACRSDLRT